MFSSIKIFDMGKIPWYVVIRGRNVGVYPTWEQCKEQVIGFPGAEYHGYWSRDDGLTELVAKGVVKSTGDPSEVNEFYRKQEINHIPTPARNQVVNEELIYLKRILGGIVGVLVTVVVLLIVVVIKVFF